MRPEAKFLTNRGDAWQARKDYDRAIADYDAALKLDPKFQRAYNNRGAAWRRKGDRGRALQDYAEARPPRSVRQDRGLQSPGDRAGDRAAGRADATRRTCRASIARPPSGQVEKAICADPGLAQLDRDINDVFLRAIASAESDNHRAALALTRQQRDFIGKRNASFGRRGYDLRQAMEERLDKLNAIARRREAGTSQAIRLDLRYTRDNASGRTTPAPSWPGLSRPSTSSRDNDEDVEARASPGMTSGLRPGETP